MCISVHEYTVITVRCGPGCKRSLKKPYSQYKTKEEKDRGWNDFLLWLPVSCVHINEVEVVSLASHLDTSLSKHFSIWLCVYVCLYMCENNTRRCCHNYLFMNAAAKKDSSPRVIYDSALGVTLKAITSYEWILYAHTDSVSTTFCQVLEQRQCSWKSIISYAFECLCGEEASHIVCARVSRWISVCVFPRTIVTIHLSCLNVCLNKWKIQFLKACALCWNADYTKQQPYIATVVQAQ